MLDEIKARLAAATPGPWEGDLDRIIEDKEGSAFDVVMDAYIRLMARVEALETWQREAAKLLPLYDCCDYWTYGGSKAVARLVAQAGEVV
jgi:hypothetical protein